MINSDEKSESAVGLSHIANDLRYNPNSTASKSSKTNRSTSSRSRKSDTALLNTGRTQTNTKSRLSTSILPHSLLTATKASSLDSISDSDFDFAIKPPTRPLLLNMFPKSNVTLRVSPKDMAISSSSNKTSNTPGLTPKSALRTLGVKKQPAPPRESPPLTIDSDSDEIPAGKRRRLPNRTKANTTRNAPTTSAHIKPIAPRFAPDKSSIVIDITSSFGDSELPAAQSTPVDKLTSNQVAPLPSSPSTPRSDSPAEDLDYSLFSPEAIRTSPISSDSISGEKKYHDSNANKTQNQSTSADLTTPQLPGNARKFTPVATSSSISDSKPKNILIEPLPREHKQPAKSTTESIAAINLNKIDTSFIAFKSASKTTEEASEKEFEQPSTSSTSKSKSKLKSNPKIYHFDRSKYPDDYGLLSLPLEEKVNIALSESFIGKPINSNGQSVYEEFTLRFSQLGTDDGKDISDLPMLNTISLPARVGQNF